MRWLALVLLFLQDPPNGPVRVKQALSTARSAAVGWDSGYFFGGLAVQPSSDKIFDSGRPEGWTFQFYSKKKCPPGKVRMVGIQVWPDSTAYPAQKKINGLGVNVVQESELEAPFPPRVDEDFMDSDRAFATFKKNGFPQATAIKLLEIRWFHGKTLWRGIGTQEQVVYLDSSAKVVAKKDDVENTILKYGARPDSFEQVESTLRKDLAEWKDAGEARLVLFDGRALDAAEFLREPKVHTAILEFYVPKPKLKRFAVRVVNDRVEWFKACLEDEPVKEDVEKQPAWTFKKFDTKKLKEGLEGHLKVKPWIEKFPKGTVRVQTIEGGRLLITFIAVEELIVRYDVVKQTLE